MKRTVILIRHAKSSWADVGAEDHERPLNKRGRASAPAVGRWLKDQGHTPDLMLVSNAARTVETAKLIHEELQKDIEVTYLASLYHAAPDTMLDELLKTSDPCVALVGHNPGIGLLARGLVAEPPAHERFFDYPTGAVTVIEFDGPIEPGQGKCLDFIIPKNLID